MMQQEGGKTLARKIDVIAAGGFILLLAGTGLVSAFSKEKGFSEEENRYLMKKPVFSIETLLDGSYGEDYEEALSDQFPGRNRWVTMKVMAERLQGQTSINGVYLGRDDYLIERFEQEDLETDRSVQNIEFLAAAVKRLKEQFGSDHVRVMMVPSASQILTEKLPAAAAPYDQMQIIKELNNAVGDKDIFVDVEKVMAEHAAEPVYYRTDHHWTSLGAYYGYAEWMASIGMVPLDQDKFAIRTVSDSFRGTVYSKLNIPVRPDTIEVYLPEKQSRYQVYYDLSENFTNELYNWDALDIRDQYKVFLDGNHAVTRIENLTLQTTKSSMVERKLLIIKDSYAHSFAPFAVNHFDTVYMVDLRYYNGDISQFISENGVSDVLVLYQIPGFCTERTIGKLRA